MSLQQPAWLLAAVPALLLGAGYIWRQWRRRACAIRFSNLELLRTIAPAGLGWRRHVAAGLFLCGLLTLAVAMARPSKQVEEPLERATIVLAIDVSLSMQADDVTPNRLAAAQEAAQQFVAELPESFNVGLVSFAKTATVLVSPTKDREAVRSAIVSLELAEATATGEAVFAALDAIRSVPGDGAAQPPPARIVLLSDGYRTYGREVGEAAQAAAQASVPVTTIAFGTDEGVVDIAGYLQRVPVDRVALAQLAELTGGFFYEAASVGELKKVYQDMGSSIGHRKVPKEITYWFVAMALMFGLAAGAWSLVWSPRLV